MKTSLIRIMLVIAASFFPVLPLPASETGSFTEKYDEVSPFQTAPGGLGGYIARARLGGKWGYIDGKGNILIPSIYDFADSFVYTRTYDDYRRPQYLARALMGKKWGYINQRGENVIPHQYDKAMQFLDGRNGFIARVEQGGESFLINAKGKRYVPPPVPCEIKSQGIISVGDGWRRIRRINCDGRWGFAEEDEGAGNPDADKKRLHSARRYTGHNDRIVIPARYQSADDFSVFDRVGVKINLARVKLDDKFGYIDEKGGVVISIVYDSLDLFASMGPPENLRYIARAVRNKRVGYINEKGEAVIPFEFEQGYSFYSQNKDSVMKNSVAVRRGGKWGYIDYTGSETIPVVYERFDPFQRLETSGGVRLMALVARDGKYGFLDTAGTAIIPLVYEMARPFQTLRGHAGALNLAAVKRDGTWGFIDAAGSTVIPLRYGEADQFNRRRGVNIARVMLKEKWIYIDDRGGIVESIEDFGRVEAAVISRGAAEKKLYRVLQSGRWGYSDEKGAIVIAPDYDEADARFHTAGNLFLARVKRDSRWGYIDDAGRVVVPLRFSEAEPFENRGGISCAHVMSGDAWEYIDTGGNVIDNPGRFPAAGTLSIGTYRNRTRVSVFTREGKQGLADEKGKLLVPARYDYLGHFFSMPAGAGIVQGQAPCAYAEVVRVRREGKWGLADMCGREVLPPLYDRLPDYFNQKFNRSMKGGKYGYLDQAGREILPFVYDEVPDYLSSSTGKDYLRRMKRDGKYGYLHTGTGEEIVRAVLDQAPDYFSMEKARVKKNGKWGYIDRTGKELGRFSSEDEPCAFPKRRGDTPVFAREAPVRSRPHESSEALVRVTAGSIVKVLSREDEEGDIEGETDNWYKVKAGKITGYIWGGHLSDFHDTISLKGRKVRIIVRNRTNGLEKCYRPLFQMKMVSGGGVISEFSDNRLSKATITVKSLEYRAMEGFSAPLNLLVIRSESRGYRDTYARWGTGSTWFYIDGGELKKVMDLPEKAGGWSGMIPIRFHAGIEFPGYRARGDAIKVKVSISAAFFLRKEWSDVTYTWDWYAMTFQQRK